MAKWMPASLYLFTFSSGVITHRFLDNLIPVWAIIIILLAGIFASTWCKSAKVFLAFVVGLCWANIVAANLLNTTIPKALEKQDVVISGKIIGVPQHTPHYVRFDFDVDEIEWEAQSYPTPGKVRLKAYHDIDKFSANQYWRFTVRLKKSRGYQNPGSRFNYETYLFESRIRATGYVRNEVSNQLVSGNINHYSVSQFRERISEFVQNNFHDDPHHGILTALMVGVRGAMRDDDWRILQNTGTIHLVAISGLHIGLVSGLIMWVVARVWRLTGQIQTRIPASTIAVCSGLLIGLCYAILAGMTIPTRRAVLMLSVIALSILFMRKPGSFELLIIVLSVVLLFDPLSPLATGFWLSFGAVTVIVCCITRFDRNTKSSDKNTWRQKLKKALSVQLALSFGLAPLLLLLFNQVSLVAPIANLIAIPVIGFMVVPMALIGLCLFALGIEGWALTLFELSLSIVEYLWTLLIFLSSQNWSVWQPSQIPSWLLISAAIGASLFLLPSAFPARATAILWLLPLFLFRPEKVDLGAFRYTLLDVGHGLASVVETRNHVLVFDTGPKFRGGMDAGKMVVVPYLKSRGISDIDMMVISHEHNDHAGGFKTIRYEFDIDQILSGVPGIFPESQPCRSGQAWEWDGIMFEFLWPVIENRNNKFVKGNNASCVLKISTRHESLLLTGDIEKEAERKLVKSSSNKLLSEVIQIPHQGSKTSSTIEFLTKVAPKLAVLSTGYLNRFGHPHQKIVDRYTEFQIPILNTAYTGAITINFDENFKVKTHRDILTGYWFQRKF